MNMDPMVEFKTKQRETWTIGNFGDMAVFTTPVVELLPWDINLAWQWSGRFV